MRKRSPNFDRWWFGTMLVVAVFQTACGRGGTPTNVAVPAKDAVVSVPLAKQVTVLHGLGVSLDGADDYFRAHRDPSPTPPSSESPNFVVQILLVPVEGKTAAQLASLQQQPPTEEMLKEGKYFRLVAYAGLEGSWSGFPYSFDRSLDGQKLDKPQQIRMQAAVHVSPKSAGGGITNLLVWLSGDELLPGDPQPQHQVWSFGMDRVLNEEWQGETQFSRTEATRQADGTLRQSSFAYILYARMLVAAPPHADFKVTRAFLSKLNESPLQLPAALMTP